MITNAGDHLFVVVNAACKQQDTARMRQYLGNRCRVEELTDRALLALQGPKAAAVMSRLAPETAKMLFMTAARVEIEGAECFVTRSGYTGEDGYEISVPAERRTRWLAPSWRRKKVKPIGLGARLLASRGGLVPLRARHRYDHQPNRGKPYLGAVQGTPPRWRLGRAATLAPMSSPGSSRRVSRKGSASGPTARRRCGGCRADRRRWRDDRQNYERLLRPHGWRAGRDGLRRDDACQPGTELQAVVRGKPQPVKGEDAVRRAALLPRMRKEGRHERDAIHRGSRMASRR